MEFIAYGRTPRFRREVVITEKLDGTNAQVYITPTVDGDWLGENGVIALYQPEEGPQLTMRSGSRNRWITPGKSTDNYGFAGWCSANSEELFKMGEGQHFGEWYGNGIARGYGMAEKRFALFNSHQWGTHNPLTPSCCEVVPVLSICGVGEITQALEQLRSGGSKAPGSTGFMSPEGIIVYHTAAKQNFKILLENDEIPKGLVTS